MVVIMDWKVRNPNSFKNEIYSKIQYHQHLDLFSIVWDIAVDELRSILRVKKSTADSENSFCGSFSSSSSQVQVLLSRM